MNHIKAIEDADEANCMLDWLPVVTFIFLGVVFAAFKKGERVAFNEMRDQAIERGFMEYDPKTGELEWTK